MSLVYSILFWDSFKALFVFSLGLETAWFAAISFGTYDKLTVTALCYAASVLGATVTYAIGYAISLMRKQIIMLDEELFAKCKRNFTKYGIYIFLFQMFPFAKVFYLFAGIFMVDWRKMLIVTLSGRGIYYLYYLYFPSLFTYQ